MNSLSATEIVTSACCTSDLVGKIIVFVLILDSIVLWSTILYKCVFLRSQKRACNKFLDTYKERRSPMAMGALLNTADNPLAAICKEGLHTLCELLGISQNQQSRFLAAETLPRPLTQAEQDKLRSAIDICVTRACSELEDGQSLLSIMVTVSPFLGLLGTVWGVMATFTNIAYQGTIEINAIAPGISGALLTTVAGLVVAIPAVCGNILLTSTINKLTLQADLFVDEFMADLNLTETDGASTGE